MCSINENLQLCTCHEKINTKQPHWRLYRKTIIQPIGALAVSDTSHVPLIALILIEQLNQRNFFDFDYEPLHEDKLTISLASGGIKPLNEDESTISPILEKLNFVYDGENKCWRHEHEAYSVPETKRTMQAKGYVKSHYQTAH